MPSSIILSSVLISFALVFYSLGIWAERFAHYLKPWHVISFWCGFLFDTLGTWTMHSLNSGHFNLFELHTFTGQIALWLMLIHAIWAAWVIKKGTDKSRKGFSKYSLAVWIVWLIPYFGGMYLGMNKHI
jgi:uncharacterized repeat protein (TIGR03987 family)